MHSLIQILSHFPSPQVVMNSHSNTHSTTQMQTLSGGEGSVTTFCMISALAEVVDASVRVLDEMDVYQVSGGSGGALQRALVLFVGIECDCTPFCSLIRCFVSTG